MPCPICHWARWPSACLTNQPLCVVLELCPLPGHPVTPPNTLQPHLCAAFLPTLSGVAPCCGISVCSSEWSGEHLPPCRRRARAEPCPLRVTVSPGPALCPFAWCPQLTPTCLHYDHLFLLVAASGCRWAATKVRVPVHSLERPSPSWHSGVLHRSQVRC